MNAYSFEKNSLPTYAHLDPYLYLTVALCDYDLSKFIHITHMMALQYGKQFLLKNFVNSQLVESSQYNTDLLQ